MTHKLLVQKFQIETEMFSFILMSDSVTDYFRRLQLLRGAGNVNVKPWNEVVLCFAMFIF